MNVQLCVCRSHLSANQRESPREREKESLDFVVLLNRSVCVD